MATVDDGLANLQRFVTNLTNATGALGKADEHMKESAHRFTELETQVTEHAGGLNDDLEKFGSTFDPAQHDAEGALSALAHAATEAQGTTSESHARVERAASDVEAKAQAILAHLDGADTHLTQQGFEALDHTLAEVQQKLEAEGGEAEQAFIELERALVGFQTDAQTAWDAADAEADAATASLGEGGSAVESAASESVEAFTTATTAFEQKCADLAQAVDLVYNVLDTAVADEGHQWEQEAQRIAKEAVAFVESCAQQRLEQPATLVEDEALAALDQEFSALGPAIEAGATTTGTLEPLAEELVKCQTMCVQIDRLLNAFA